MIRVDIRAARAQKMSATEAVRAAHARKMSSGMQMPGSDVFQMFIKPLAGPSILMKVFLHDTIGHVKEHIYDVIGYNPDKIVLTLE